MSPMHGGGGVFALFGGLLWLMVATGLVCNLTLFNLELWYFPSPSFLVFAVKLIPSLLPSFSAPPEASSYLFLPPKPLGLDSRHSTSQLGPPTKRIHKRGCAMPCLAMCHVARTQAKA